LAFPEEENLLLPTIHKFEPRLQEMYIIRQSVPCEFKNNVFNSLELRKEIKIIINNLTSNIVRLTGQVSGIKNL
jgi:hypothetical protein